MNFASILSFPWRKLKPIVCRHNRSNSGLGVFPPGLTPLQWTILETKALGVTLGWDARPQVQTRSRCRCHLCGGEFWTAPGYMPNDPKFKRNADGWPLNEDGSRMAIAKD